MSKCIGDCAKCTLPVDKSACCMFQIFKNVLEMKARVKALEENMGKTTEVIQYRTLEDLEEVEQDKN